MDTLSDAELIERILSGERELYAVIVRRYQEKLHRYAVGMLRDADAAADLTQDSFIKAYTSLPKCRNRHQFSAWIFRIVRNRCTDYIRAPARKQVSLETESAYLYERESPETDLERNEVRDAIEQALATLPASQREAFLLKHVEDLSYEEMADLLGVRVGALKMRVMRAREALQAALQHEGIGETLSL